MNQAQQMIEDLKRYNEARELEKIGTSMGVARTAEEAQSVVHRSGIKFDGTKTENGDTVFMQAGRMVARWIPKPDGMVVRIDDPHAPGKNP